METKRNVNKIGIVSNIKRDENYTYTRSVVEFLKAKGITITLNSEFDGFIDINDFASFSTEDTLKETEALIVLGGDGTMLQAAAHAALMDIPLLGINTGDIGYVTDAEKHDGLEAIGRFLDGDYTLDSRSMLRGLLDENEENILALNEICVSRPTPTLMVRLTVDVNGANVADYKCDGVLISTPTGSTAYNLAAGGPLLPPQTSAFVITPVCPHSLHHRPIVVSDTDVITIKLGDGAVVASVLADGVSCGEITSTSKIVIRKALEKTKLINTTNLSFYDRLRIKIK